MKKLFTTLLIFIGSYGYSQLYVPSGETIFTTSTGELTSKENVTNNGTIYSVEMNKTTAQTLSGTGTLRYLKANNSVDISLSSVHNVTNNGITLTAGKIIIGNFNLTTASVSNDTADRYIKTSGTGLFRMNATTSAYTKYPVGNSSFNYIRVYNNNAAADTFAVRVQDTLYANVGSSMGSISNSVNRTWYITKTSANSGSGVNIEFNWNAGDLKGTLSNATLYEYNGTKWVKSSGTQSVSGNQLTINGYTGTLSGKQFMVASALGASVSVATSVCQSTTGVNATFTGSNGNAPYTFTYTINGGSNQTVTTASGNSATVNVSTSTAGNIIYTLVTVEDITQQNSVTSADTIVVKATTSSSTTASACGSYLWNGTTYTTSGTKTWTGTNAAGCDSLVTLNLTINNATSSSESASACGSYAWHGTTYTSSNNAATWTGTNAAGCDSLVTLNLTINNATSSTETASACGSYTWHGTTYTSSNNTATWTGTNAAGCDSVVTLNLTINNATSSTETASACGSYVWHGTTYTASNNTATWTGTNAAGCDSVVTLNLTINAATSSTETASACGSYVWHGTTYTASNNTATWTGTNAAGCDSVVTLNLTINAATSSTETASACGSYVWHGTTYTASNNTATWTGTNAAGCDSVVTLNLTINNATSSTETASACGSYVWHGTTYTASNNTATWTGTNAAGCDSVVTLNLTITSATSSTETASACGSYVWHGTTYTASNNTATWIGTNAAGCDSVVTLNLTINNATSSTETASACGSYVWHGTTYTASNNTATWTGTNAVGCDSVVTLNLTITSATSSTETASACGSYVWHGTTYTASNNTATWTGTNAAGCDSVVTLQLTIKQSSSSSQSATANLNYTWNGNTYNQSGSYTWTGTNAVGCDSVAVLVLTINNGVTSIVSNVYNVCTYIGTNQTLSYTASVAGASSYTWTLPVNTQLVSGQGTRTITIKLLNGFASQANKQIRVTPAGGSLQIIYVAAQSPLTPASITASSNSICDNIGSNVPVTFKIPKVIEPVSNGITATSYIWSAQNGTTTITHPNGAGENDTLVTVTFANNFSSSNITVQAVNPCGVSSMRSYLITRSNPGVGLITGPTNACEYSGTSGVNATYSATTNAGVYTWTIPAGCTNISGQGTNTISFRYPAGFTNGSVSVYTTNGCGVSQTRTMAINRILPGAPSNIDVINTELCPNRVYTYTLAAMPYVSTSLLWTVPASATLVSGQGTTSITVSYPNTVINGNITVKAVSNCGVGTMKSLIVKMAPCPASPSPQNTKGSIGVSSMDVNVFPNPTTSIFNLQVTTAGSKSVVNARVLDLQGRLMKTIMVHPYENVSLGSELKPGVYMLEVLQGTEKKVVRVVKY